MVEEFIARIPLFASLRRKEIGRLAEIMIEVCLPADTILFHEGDSGDRLYIILEGRLEAVKAMGTPEERVLNVQGPGEYLGEMCLLNPEGRRSAGIRTRTPVRLLEMARDTFDALLHRNPAIALAVAQRLTQRLTASEDQYTDAFRRRQSRGGESVERRDEEDETADPVGAGRSLSSAAPVIHIGVLGFFQVLSGEAPIPESAWKGNQPRLLLKAIVARGGRGVPKEVLMEDLWPESDPESAERNFKVLLHRLRKALQPSCVKGSASPYLKQKSGLIFLDPQLCRVDVDRFLSLCVAGGKREEEGDVKRALSAYREAVELYRGDFLAEDLYVQWAESKRAEIKEKYTDLLFRMGEIHENLGASKNAVDCYKSVLLSDPLSEKACQKLMRIYSNRGMRGEALKVYESCRKAISEELDAEPDKLTTSLYKRILETT